MKQSLIILGAGQFGAMVKEIAESIGCYDRVDFLDDQSSKAIGRLEEYHQFVGTYHQALVAIGNPAIRLGWIERLRAGGYEIATLVSPKAVVLPSAVLGEGTIVEPMAVVQTGAVVGKGCIISSGAVVRHNAVLGAVCHCDCNAVVLSTARMPEGTKVPCGQSYS